MGCSSSNPCSKLPCSKDTKPKKKQAFKAVYEKDLPPEAFHRPDLASDDDSESYGQDRYVSPKDAKRILKRQERVVEAMEALQADAALKSQMYHTDGELYGDALSGTGLYAFSNQSDSSVRQRMSLRRGYTTSHIDALGRQVWPNSHAPTEPNWAGGRDSIRAQQYPPIPYHGSPYPNMELNPMSPYGSLPGPMMAQSLNAYGQRTSYRVPNNYHQIQMVSPLRPQQAYTLPITKKDPFQTTPVYNEPNINPSISSRDGSSNLDELLIQSILHDTPNLSDSKKKESLHNSAIPSGDKVQTAEGSPKDDEKVTDKDVFAVDFYEPSSSRRTPTKEYTNPFGVEESGSALADVNPFGVSPTKGSQGDLSSDSSDAVRRREMLREIDEIIS